ncbi:kelch repeat and BTB domain-containing protein 11 [Thalassophryne amazonica]|uniref:kelch repeat and BTB domain-containing protein 11 n=1 Tax=Thalassophryne amazonica TaxID=390379 RepID=UPI001471271F|nr:kelch repeat and BTB domain-containing protein 11 [Thalassophryne amazonica]
MTEGHIILHGGNADLITPGGKDGDFCPRYVHKDEDFSAPLKEYLLDGQSVGGRQIDHLEGNASLVSKTEHISNHIVVMEQNYASSENHNGATVKAFYSCGSSGRNKEESEGDVSTSRETSVIGQGPVPDTHCVTAGTKPAFDGLAHRASDPPDYESLHRHSIPISNHESRDSSQETGCTASTEEPDLVIEVSGQKINVHKSILAEKSDYFKARLSRDILKVKGVSYKTLSTLIDYVYTSQMNVSKDNVVDVITGAKILQIPCAVQAAMDSMSEQITAGNCYEILTIAKKQRLGELKETAYGFMSDNFLQILKDPSVYGRLTGSERDLILKKRMEGRRTLLVAETNDVFDRVGSRPPSRSGSRPQSPSSTASFEDSRMIYYFNEKENDWRSLTTMPEDLNTKGCGICTMYNYLFVAGGIKGYGDKGKVSDRVFYYNPITNCWTEVRPLNQARAQLKLVSMDGYLYAIGGECLFTVEKYDPRMDRWTTVAPLPKGAFAVAHEATTCSGELYVSGGSLFYRLLKYDSKRDEWQECPYNNSRKKSSDMVALKSFIYRFDVNREQGINVFKYNTIVKMWHDCVSQRLGTYLPFRCAVIGNCIYCVNKSQTLQFVVEEESVYFVEEALRAPVEAKGVLFPFVLTLPEKVL